MPTSFDIQSRAGACVCEVVSLYVVLSLSLCRVDWIGGKKEKNRTEEEELEPVHSFGRRIASHCTWAERVEERRGLQDDCVINVPSYQFPPPSLPPLFLFLRCKWSQHDFLSSKRRCSVSIAADDADACVCGCMLVGHLTRPVAHCPPTLTMIDVSSFIFFLFFSFSRLSVRES